VVRRGNRSRLHQPPRDISDGDCDLAEVKKLYGGKLALMGNLHTTDVMLLARPRMWSGGDPGDRGRRAGRRLYLSPATSVAGHSMMRNLPSGRDAKRYGVTDSQKNSGLFSPEDAC